MTLRPLIRDLVRGPLRSPLDRRGGWTPAILSPTAWYDPSDLSTQFQDSAGTTAATAGQPAGLVLDKSQAVAASASAADGACNTATWTKQTGWSAPSARSLVCDGSQVASTDANFNSATNTPAAAGRLVRWTFTVQAITGSLQVFPSAGSPISAIATPGTYRAYGAGDGFAIFRMQGADDTCTITDIRIEFVAGNHLTQATAASRPTLVLPSTFYVDRADGIDDSLSAASGGGGAAGILLCAAITVSGGAASARTIFSDAGANTGYRLRVNATNQLELAAGNGVAFTTIATVAAFPVGETHVVMAWDDGANLNVQIDNGATASVARPAVSAGTAALTLFKDNGAASSFLPGDSFQMVYVKDSAKTAAERARLKTFVGAKAGLVL